MTETLVIDASIAVKWVVEEDGTPLALGLRQRHRLAAPELLTVECANILWKKIQRGELSREEAKLAANLLERSDIELFGMRGLLAKATELATDIGHPAYDCMYICLAMSRNWRFVTADERLTRVLNQKAPPAIANLCVTLEQFSSGSH
ncbi:type II toxin-antitoxin system VapC family toxin [Mesorhizobium sp. BH1-1-5]|uniref:type II toxin-antitoxin system VapC family toxin n=1 Tax=unclassified Mesorhizobium TaxID=325217 RepID=UPI001128D1C6|nr:MULTISPECIES: type II toxin-antitoxin system VapC family toxin [unclassified Mesorhizobium]MBZ9991203.1 type II toxin-antitoxin system VapC family toxin [Mesorhizobium sp. BH1-1-5]TPJ74648.1 type II toxin-antitoxin system VapC family toxin [Mesorhizobium sp. B2-7-1]